jgi:hypothetical protein
MAAPISPITLTLEKGSQTRNHTRAQVTRQKRCVTASLGGRWFQIRIDNVIPDVAFDDFSHQSVDCSPARRDGKEQIVAILFCFKRALYRYPPAPECAARDLRAFPCPEWYVP